MKKYFSCGLLLFLVILGNSIIYSQDKKTKVEAFYWQARYFMNTNNLKKAEEILKSIIEIDDKFADAYFSLYEIYLSQEKLEEALIYLNKIKEINYKESALTYETRALNIEEEIKKLKKKIAESKKIKLPRKKEKKKFKVKNLFLKLKKEEKEKEEIKNIIPVKIIYGGENKIKMYRGYTDDFKAGDEIYLIKDKKIIGRVRLVRVGQFSSEGEIIEILDREKLKSGETITESITRRVYALP